MRCSRGREERHIQQIAHRSARQFYDPKGCIGQHSADAHLQRDFEPHEAGSIPVRRLDGTKIANAGALFRPSEKMPLATAVERRFHYENI